MKKYHTFIKSAVGIAVVFGLFKIMIIPVKVDGNSMLGTLHDGDIALLNRWSVSKKSIQRFDVVVIKSKALNENIVKRVIGLPGETIEYKEDHLYVNGKYVKETYFNKSFVEKQKASHNTKVFTFDFKITLKSDEYFVLGDNRLNSMDSRTLGAFSINDIISAKGVVVFPPKNFGVIE